MSTSSEQLPAQPARRPWPLAPEPEPVFGMLEVVFAFLGWLLAILLCSAIAIVVARHLDSLSRVPLLNLEQNVRIILLAQLVAYGLLIIALWRLFAHYFRIGFLRALSWHWPLRWPMFLVGGALLALAVLFSARLLPTPPELPIDKMMRTPFDGWLMCAFGVLIAPFTEEVLFRGLLFPALVRPLGTLLSFVFTATLFGAFHALQLGGAWIQVACIIVVGGVLTMVRWRFRSLASSTLVHMGYNGALFAALFVQTRGFTNFSGR